MGLDKLDRPEGLDKRARKRMILPDETVFLDVFAR
jgi:hypothetical protein